MGLEKKRDSLRVSFFLDSLLSFCYIKSMDKILESAKSQLNLSNTYWLLSASLTGIAVGIFVNAGLGWLIGGASFLLLMGIGAIVRGVMLTQSSLEVAKRDYDQATEKVSLEVAKFLRQAVATNPPPKEPSVDDLLNN